MESFEDLPPHPGCPPGFFKLSYELLVVVFSRNPHFGIFVSEDPFGIGIFEDFIPSDFQADADVSHEKKRPLVFFW